MMDQTRIRTQVPWISSYVLYHLFGASHWTCLTMHRLPPSPTPCYMIFALNDHLPRFFPLAGVVKTPTESLVRCSVNWAIWHWWSKWFWPTFVYTPSLFNTRNLNYVVSCYIFKYLSIKCLFLDIIGLITVQTTRLCRQNEYQALARYNLSAPPCVL